METFSIEKIPSQIIPVEFARRYSGVEISMTRVSYREFHRLCISSIQIRTA